MADSARDLTINLVTEADQFDTSQAAADLQNLGDAADDTARQQADLGDTASQAQADLDRLAGAAGDAAARQGALGDAATGAESDLDRLAQAAQDADTAVRGVDDAADSTRGGLGQLDDATEATSGAFGDMRDEAGAALMETAGSFDGTMTGLIDGVQGALPALGAAFGGIGLAAGSALAAGVGLFKARAAALTESVNGLVSSIIADGGRLSRDSVFAKLEEFAADESINKLARQAEKARIPVEDFLLAMAGDPAALERSTAALQAQNDEVIRLFNAGNLPDDFDLTEYSGEYLAVSEALGTQAEAQGRASDAVRRYQEVTDEAKEATERKTAAEETAAAAADAYAAAVSGVTEEAVDMAEAIEEGADAVEAAQERQIRAAEDFEKNMATVYGNVGQDGVDWALDQGENADAAMQLLANAPLDQQQRIVANYRAVGNSASASVVAGIRNAVAPAQSAAREVVRSVQRELDGRPFTFRTRVDPSGYDSGVRTMIRSGRVAV